VDKNPKLRALYFTKREGIEEVRELQPSDVMNRTPALNSPLNMETASVDLLDMITRAEMEAHALGLKNAGLSVSIIKQVKNLDGLAENTGKFLTIAVKTLSSSYYVQTLELMALARKTHKRLMASKDQEGYIADDEARAWFNRNYTDMVKEAGRAFELFLHAIQAMVQMILKPVGKGDTMTGKKKIPGLAVLEASVERDPVPS